MAGQPVTVDLSQVFSDPSALIAAVVQDASSGALLMVAYQNREAFDKTVETGFAHFYSRSRKQLWRKGETSGNVLHVREIRLDCDTDAVLLTCDAAGPTCHTGETSCFYRVYRDGELIETKEITHQVQVLSALDAVIAERKASPSESSYTSKLLAGGVPTIGAKVTEEATELVAAAANESDDRVAAEAADLIYHAMVLLRSRGLSIMEVMGVLSKRFGIGGLDEKRRRNRG